MLKTFALTVPTLSYVAALWVCQQRSLSLSTVGEANRFTYFTLLTLLYLKSFTGFLLYVSPVNLTLFRVFI